MRIVFMGTGEIALPSFRWLVDEQQEHEIVGLFTQPDKKVGRKQILTPPEVKTMAMEAGIPVFQPVSFRKDPEALPSLLDLQPDLSIVMAYGQILPEAVIEAPSTACVNLHASLLPRHRGASPIQAAIRDGDGETGITLMHVVKQLDAGDMILKETTPIRRDDTGGILHDRLAGIGPILLEKGLPLLASGTAPAIPQDEDEVTYSGKLEREDGEIDWSQSAESIERLLRAYEPWPGTYSFLPHHGSRKKVKLFPYAETAGDSGETPGTILAMENGITVACGEGILRLTGQLQWEGKKRLPVDEFLRGSTIRPGERFGRYS